MNRTKMHLLPAIPLIVFLSAVVTLLAWFGVGGNAFSSDSMLAWGNLAANSLVAMATCAAVVLVYATLIETREMLREARETTTAARATADAAFLEQRPWLELSIADTPRLVHPFEGALPDHTLMFDLHSKSIKVGIDVRNKGRTPALDVQCSLAIGIGTPVADNFAVDRQMVHEHRDRSALLFNTIMPEGRLEKTLQSNPIGPAPFGLLSHSLLAGGRSSQVSATIVVTYSDITLSRSYYHREDFIFSDLDAAELFKLCSGVPGQQLPELHPTGRINIT